MCRRIQRVLFFLLLTLAVLFDTGCGSKGGAGGTEQGKEAPKTEVIIDKVAQEDVQLYLYASGNTMEFNSVDIRARVAGYLEKRLFESGDFVQANDQLALIEQAQYKIALASAEAELLNHKARLELAEANLERAKKLIESKASTPEEFQSAQAERDMAAASVQLGKTVVENAQLNLDYTVVKSPITGKIARWQLDVGNYVSPTGQSVLISVAQLDPIYVDFQLSDRQFIELKDRIGFLEAFEKATGKEHSKPQAAKKPAEDVEHPLALTGGNVDISLQTGVNVLDFNFTLTGKVIAQVDNVINIDSGQITLRAQLSNPLLDINGSKEHMIAAGQVCRVRIPYEKMKGAVLIREESVLTDLDTKYVLLVTKGKYQPTDRMGQPAKGVDGKPIPAYETDIVQRRDIKIGQLLDNQMRIVLSGLQQDEDYIVKGVQRVRIGMEVKPVTLEEYNKRRAEEAKVKHVNQPKPEVKPSEKESAPKSEPQS
jgi:membrane fusion protein (multidrug efflux system)